MRCAVCFCSLCLLVGNASGWVQKLAINQGVWRDKKLGIHISGTLDLPNLEKELAQWAQSRYLKRICKPVTPHIFLL